MYIKALEVLNGRSNPDFDANATIYRMVPPPPNAQIEPGDPPELIKDPELRKAYVEAIAKNKFNVALLLEEREKENACSSISNALFFFIRNCYPQNERSELTIRINSSKLSQQQKADVLRTEN